MSNENPFNQPNPDDKPNIGLNILSFCIPLAGLIIYLVHKDKSPIKANSAGKFALISVGIGIVFRVIAAIFGGA